MCWTRTDRQISETQGEKFATKKDEGEAFRNGRVTNTPKPLPDEQPKQKELVDS